jgi:hypothetical protein
MRGQFKTIGFEVLSLGRVLFIIIWDVIPCSSVEVHQYFGGIVRVKS